MTNRPGTSTSSGKSYEMLWDCRFCGTKKLLGKTHRFCPNCGAQQDASWRYFPSDEEKVEAKDHVYVGADKICPACTTLNAAQAEFCGNCGSPLTDAARAKAEAARERADHERFETEDLEKKREAQQADAQTATAPPRKGLSLPVLLLLIIVPVIIGGIIFALTRTTESTAYVTGFRWERTIAIESLQAVPGRSDCNAVPLGAYSVDQRYEQVGSRSVPDGEECRVRQVDQGDGTFREERVCEQKYRSEPVYGYVCYFLTNQWLQSRVAKAEGDKNAAPQWPSTNLRAGSCLGCEREAGSGRNERYYLMLRGSENRDFECPVPFNQWQETGIERGFTVEVYTVLQQFRCDTLKPVQ